MTNNVSYKNEIIETLKAGVVMFLRITTILLSLFTPILLIILVSCFVYKEANASEAGEKVYLTQILNQLNTMQPLILAAQKEQPANQRIQFHYTQYRDGKGQLHNGLFEDVQNIKKGLEEELNQTSIEPRSFAPIQGDYVDKANNKQAVMP